ncbi:MAG: hypothetical protein ACKO7W_02230 [Elainella sp.]
MNLQLPSVHPPDQLPPPDLPQREFWRQVFPELVLLWASGLLIGMRIVASLSLSEALGAISLAACVALSTGWAKGQLALKLRSGQLHIPAWQQFTANLLLGLAKLTAAAALLLELARYGLQQLPQADSGWLLPVALLALLALTVVLAPATALQHWKPRSWLWLLPVGLLLLGVGWIELTRLGGLRSVERIGLSQISPTSWPDLLQATALLAVAYPSYEPLSLPVPTIAASTVRLVLKALGLGLGLGWLLFWGTALLANSSLVPTLITAASDAGIVRWIGLAAMATLTGALLTLLPQLTRQLLYLNQEVNQQARNSQVGVPQAASYPDKRPSPVWGLIGLSMILAALLLLGDLESFWSFSAFAGLMQAALVQWTLLTAGLPASRPFRRGQTARSQTARSQTARSWGARLPLRWLSLRECFQGLRLAVCLLAFWVDWQVWLVSLSLVTLGLVWRGMMQWSDHPGD